MLPYKHGHWFYARMCHVHGYYLPRFNDGNPSQNLSHTRSYRDGDLYSMALLLLWTNWTLQAFTRRFWTGIHLTNGSLRLSAISAANVRLCSGCTTRLGAFFSSIPLLDFCRMHSLSPTSLHGVLISCPGPNSFTPLHPRLTHLSKRPIPW